MRSHLPTPTRGLVCRALLLLAGICIQAALYGQLTANFTASPVSGCAPLLVNFTDQSTGNPTQWKWTLGNGVTSVLKNPSATYFNPGTYSVKLVIYSANGADSITKTQFITVYASPVVNFNASDTAGCFPLQVNFSDLSTPGNGTVTAWHWDFGDGYTSTAQHPSHTYLSSGNYAVTLKVTNSFGCSKTIVKSQYIKVSAGVTAAFTHTGSSPCFAPVTINFQNTSAGPGVLSYNWNFGDGSSSTAANPVHTYNNNGSYTVQLITTSTQGCRDTLIQPNLVVVGNLNSAFNAPDTICLDEPVTFSNTTTPAPVTVSWNFGDGGTSSTTSPVHAFTSAGTYTVKLVNNFGACSDSFSRNIVVVPRPVAQFSAPTTVFCDTPAVVSFVNQSAAATGYLWDFGDGTTSTAQNPVHVYNAEGTFTVTLTAYGGSCTDVEVKQQYITVQKPIITIAGLPQSGCRPLTIQPVATVTSAQGISTYTWYFGDGTTGTGTSPVHTYTTLGSFDVMLVVTTTGGCSDTLLIPDAVKTGDKPQANFSVNPVNVCAFQNVQFNDLTTGTPDAWYWQFGDGGTSSDQNPLYQYSDTGWFTVTLFTWSNNCPDTFTIVNAIYVKPPIANFTVAPGCVNKFKKDFTDQSVGAETWFWNFGDGTSSTQQHPSHTYTNPGTYTVSLTVTNDSCSHTRDMTVYVVDETVDFTISSPVVCKNVPVQFASTGMNAANISSWSWDFGDGSVASAHPVSHAYSAAGTYQVTLTATDLNGCVGTKTRPVTVYGPTAQFSVQTPVTCHGNADIFFNDASATDGSHPIVQWTWNYGDGVIDSNASLPYHHVYGSPGVYPVLLTVKDSYGCTDALTIPAAVTVTKPLAQFTVADTAFCTNTTVQFNNTSSGNNLQFNWNFGDGTTSTVASPAHSYTSAGIYTVTLIATDASGCKDTMVRTSFIHIVPPLASFTMSDTASTCPPLMVDFVNTSVNYSSVHWDFGDSTSSTLANPSHFYTMPGVYVVKLTITGVSGCTDVFMRTININGPSGTFTYTPLSGCNPLTVTFTANSWNRSYFVWDFSDGVTITTTDSVVTHTYTTPGTYLPKMILVNDAGCAVPVLGNDPIEVYGADAHFGIQNYPFCDSASVSFSDSTFMNDAITSYLWNFGDGTTSTSQNPVHLYTTPGSYTISLAVTTVSGCMDTATMVNAVNIYESPVIDIIGDTTACVPASLAYSGVVIRGDSLSWNWNLSTSTSAAQVPPVQNYIIPGTYYVSAIATNQHGCSDTVIRRVQVNPVPVVNAGPDAVSCLGTPVQLAASGATQYSWNASPDLSCTGCSTTSALPQQSTTYVVTGTNTFGCKASDSVHVRVRMPFVLQEPLNDSICTGSSARLTAGGAEVYSWSPAATLDNASSATPRATPTMTTTYTVIAADSDGCFSDTATATIYVWPIPVVDAGYDQNIEVGTSVQLASTSSSDVTSWKWMPSLGLSCSTCPNPVAQPQKTTEYKLQVKNPAGCQAEDQMRIIVTCGKGNLFLPNTFSPNGDGSNDRFYPRGSGIARIKSLRVFNRWGEVVFERLNFDVNQAGAGWDGMYKGKPASPDVYVFTCEVVCLNNEVLEYKGDISLLR